MNISAIKDKKIDGWFVTYGVFPLLIIGVPALGYYISFVNNIVIPEISLPLLLAIGFFIIYYFENRYPYVKEWNEDHHDKKADIFHFISNSLILVIFQNLGLYLLTNIGYTGFFNKLELRGLEVPWLVQFFIFYLIIEFIHYIMHKYSHTIPFLWKLHQVHHSTKRLYALNSFRIHFLDTIIRIAIPALLILFLGVSKEAVFIYTLHSSFVGFLHHSNIRINYTFWNYIFSTADLHRFHHSKKIHISNTNYGKSLILFDIFFGTYFKSPSHDIHDVGVEGSEMPDSFLQQSKFPFLNKDK